ncbi:MAG TPA: hypothetical protein VFT19_01490 [Solirubrobacterales bacterium]|nr:hypothetical protein [Solirubrobacterales bacterium]
MIATYAAALAICGASLAIGQAAVALCGARRWSWLSPAVGLALVCAICWATVRMPGHGAVSAVAILVLAAASAIYLRRRVEDGGEALRAGAPVALGALLAASLPFAVEGHFGILGTGFNPDMSQHLLATDRLAAGHGSQLLREGYPLGPHAVVVALNKGLGIGLVQGFGGLTIAVAVLAPLTALAAFGDLPPLRRTAAALLVGIPYLVASYYAQGAFKETIQALFVLAFVLALRESGRSWSGLPLRFVPAALVAVGSIYAYSFPSLVWLAPIALIWLALQRPLPLRPLLLALAVFAVGALPELGRMIDFKQFETFDPSGPGLGNLFGQVSPLTALGIWPSGDFRVAPGDGAAPAIAFYLGAAFAAALLALGIRRAWRSRESALLAGLLSVAAVYAAARIGGTAYTAAKALEIAAPLLTLTILLQGRAPSAARPAAGSLLYLLVAGACTLVALANAPVGPTSYSPALTGLRPLLAKGSTLVLAPDKLLEDEQGRAYVAWELRGGRVCIEPEGAADRALPTGIRYVVTTGPPASPPYPRLAFREQAGPYVVWERRGVAGGPSPCPLIAVRQARAGGE